MPIIENVPVFKLYGEKELWPTHDLLHCESISSRSKLHDWHIKTHQHDDLFQLLYLTNGSAQIQLDDQHHAMRAEQLLLVPPMCIHGFKFDRHAEGYVVTVGNPLIVKVCQQMGDMADALNHPGVRSFTDDQISQHTKTAFSLLDSEYKQYATDRNLFITSLLTSILIWVSRSTSAANLQSTPNKNRSSAHFIEFRKLIEQNYISHHLVAFYAKKIGITPAHLNVISREITGKSALELIHERLLLEAKRNLIFTNMTISAISYALGFSEPAYFARFFKRSTSLSPKDFKKTSSYYESHHPAQ